MTSPGGDLPVAPKGKSPLDALGEAQQARKRAQREPSARLTVGVENERLRQEREAFDQRKLEVKEWSRLRLTMG